MLSLQPDIGGYASGSDSDDDDEDIALSSPEESMEEANEPPPPPVRYGIRYNCPRCNKNFITTRKYYEHSYSCG